MAEFNLTNIRIQNSRHWMAHQDGLQDKVKDLVARTCWDCVSSPLHTTLEELQSDAIDEFNSLLDQMKPNDAFETMRVRIVTFSMSLKLKWLLSKLELISGGDDSVAELCDSDCLIDQVSTLVELLGMQPEESDYIDKL